MNFAAPRLRAPQRVLAALLLLSSAPAVDARPGQDPRLRVACVGDSITEGNANAEHALNSWPRILGRLLERELPGRYQVENFGRSGATLLRQGHKPYWDQDVFERSRAFLPEIVVINLGTNDATERNWLEHGEEFERDLRALIGVYRALESEPQIWLSNLTPMYAPHPRTEECAPHRVVIERTIDALAQEYGLGVIDLETPTAEKPELFPDGLHPNTAGNELMAQAVFEALTGRTAPDDPSIRPKAVPGTARDLVAAGKALQVRLGTWSQGAEWIEGTGARKLCLSKLGVDAGDFHLRARLRMLGQRNSAAGFAIDENFFGFEGARGTVFRNGPHMGGLRLLHPSEQLWEREAWIDFEVIRNDGMVWFLVDGQVVDMAAIPEPIERLGFDPTRSTMQVSDWSIVGSTVEIRPEHHVRRTVNTPWVDLTRRDELRKLLRRDPGQSAAALPGRRRTLLRSPDEKELLCLVSDWDDRCNPLARTSRDDGESWSPIFELPASLNGEGHCAAYLPDGRLMLTFRDRHRSSPTQGDLVAWVGTYGDVVEGREGELTYRLLDGGTEPEAVGLEVLPDGTLLSTNRWQPDADGPQGLVQVRLTLAQLQELVPSPGYDIPLVDLDAEPGRHVLVDREAGQYLGHVSTELLEDGRTILAVYPKGHGKGEIVYKRSSDGGLSWSERLPTPASWATSREVPTIHRVIDPASGKKRLILWSGLYPARLAVSEDDGASWSELEPAGDWGGIVVMGFVERLRDGSYLAMFHDDGRFFSDQNRRADPRVFTLYQTFSRDGGLTWSQPEVVWSGSDVHLCEPGCVRSPDGATLAVLLRENSRSRNSYVIFSEDEGRSWSAPRELPASLTGDRHTAAYAPDGRLFLSFRDTTRESVTQGDWVGWVGTWEDLRNGRPGQYRVRLKDNKHRWDTTYPGVEVLPDGTFVATTYGHWEEGQQPYILCARFTLDELDERAARLPEKTGLFLPGMRGVHTYRIPALVTTQRGTLIACCDARVESGRDLPNQIDTVVRRSTDGGRSWGPVVTILDWSGSEGAADPCLLVDRESGRIWCAVTWADGVGWSSSRPGYGKDSLHALLVYSDDDGRTWSEPVDITRSIKDPEWRSAWFSPGVGLQSASGRLFLPYSAADGEGAMHTYAAVSDDHGATWRRVGPIGSNTNESMLVQLADGVLLCNMRSKHGHARRALSVSRDDGESWSPIEHHPELVEPVCQASLLTVPAERTPDGREWLLFCNPASTTRERLTLRVSRDGGETWPVERVVHSGPTAYSCLTLLPEGGIGLLYERGIRHPYEGITFASIPLAWFAGEDSDD